MGKLSIVATPIGNLEDITLRALRVLKEADIIACEDTGHSLPLLLKYDIKKPLLSYWKAKEAQKAEELLFKLEEGKHIALITDAGMPCISDPGSIIVRLARQAGHEIEVVPGACACVSAYALSGFEGGFSFLGFLPSKKSDRRKFLEKQRDNPLCSIFYVAPHDYKKDISDIMEVFGDRECAAVREMTKIHEEVVVDKLSVLVNAEARGEYVLVVKGNENEQASELNELSLEEHVIFYKQQGLDKKECVKKVAAERGLVKNDVYQVALKIYE